MPTFKCKMCGGDLEISEGMTVCECEYCGTKQTVPTTKDEVVTNLFNRANNLRIKSEFDKAQEIYEKIVSSNADEAEAYWGIVLCKFGIEYVEDPATFKKIPTCHRTQLESVMTDVDYLAAVEHADAVQKGIYEEEARTIDALQKDILKIVQNEQPFDVFICYKETDENGKRTNDSVIANDIYHQLTQEGFKVFYAAITLEDKLGQEYEPYIFAALTSAKVMLTIGTKPEYFNAVWVKNEWSRFLKLMKSDRSKLLIPCYKDMDAYDLPEEFSHLQAQDMSKIGFINDVVREIKKVIAKDEPKAEAEQPSSNTATGNASIDPLLRRAFMFLEDGEWDSADEYANRVLDMEPECGDAYVIRLMADLEMPNYETPYTGSKSITSSKYFSKVQKYAKKEVTDKILSCFIVAEDITHKCIIHDGVLLGIFRKDNFSCSAIKIPQSVTSIGDDAFSGCTSLTNIIIPKGVKSIGDFAFSKCTSLTNITIPKGVTSIGDYAFQECTSLTNITIPESVTSIGDCAFCRCTSLTNITIPESVTSIGYCAFNECISIKELHVPSGVTDIGGGSFNGVQHVIFDNDDYSTDGYYVYKNNQIISALSEHSELHIPEGVTSIGERGFSGCESLTKITIPESVTSIGDDAFWGCTSLTSITIPEGVTSIEEEVFSGCESLTNITIPESVTSIGKRAFCECKSLTSITIPEGVTSIGGSAFLCCEKLEIVVYCDSYAEKYVIKNKLRYKSIKTAKQIAEKAEIRNNLLRERRRD